WQADSRTRISQPPQVSLLFQLRVLWSIRGSILCVPLGCFAGNKFLVFRVCCHFQKHARQRMKRSASASVRREAMKRLPRTSLPCVLLLFALPLPAADPEIKNRPPKPDEIGYRPVDGATARLNPPSLIWLHETNAQTYAVQWAKQPDFSEAVTASGFRCNT